MCMMVDEEFWDFYVRKARRARKPHQCGECGRTIDPGEQYEVVAGSGYGNWYTHKTCSHCTAASYWLEEACDGYIYGARQEDLGEHVVGEERWFRTAPLTRLYRWMLADWRRRDGSLRTVDEVETLTRSAVAAYRRQMAERRAA